MTKQDFIVRSVRVSECMLNAAEDLVSNLPGINSVDSRKVCISPSYSVRFEKNEVMLFSSITRYIIWLTRAGYDFLMEHENETQSKVIQNITDAEESLLAREFFNELNKYGVLSAA